MGYLIERTNKKGQTRYTAVYCDIKGKLRSAGTFGTAKAAGAAWHRAEARLAEGRIGDPKRGRQRLVRYIEDHWFPNHVIEATTREGYRYMLDRYILPELGGMRMVEILPGHVREWVAKLAEEYGANPPTIEKAKVVLDAALTTAFNDQITFLHAGKGVKTPTVAKRTLQVVTPEEFDTFHEALADPVMRLMVETAIESGLRWGELTELRPKDINWARKVITVSRAVVELKAKNRPEGVRFVVKGYPKDGESRDLGLADHIVAKLEGHIAAHGLGQEDLLFWQPQPTEAARRVRPAELPDPETLGSTEADGKGRSYRHGTVTAYNAAKCRCQYCRDAVSAYRAERRAAGADEPRRRRVRETDGHISNDWFRRRVWQPALTAAGLNLRFTPHGLRHAHASWLVAGGADLQVVKERMGHGSISTTERYLHTLRRNDDAALAALAAIRGRSAQVLEQPANADQPQMSDVVAMMAKLTEMYQAASGERSA